MAAKVLSKWYQATTKYGNAGITSNIIIEPTKGGKREPLILRGAYISCGGTAELVAPRVPPRKE
eukprot:scaffold137214_cov33-Tisochrysis_lutea.AAC.1